MTLTERIARALALYEITHNDAGDEIQPHDPDAYVDRAWRQHEKRAGFVAGELMGSEPKPSAVELGPDGKEWAKTEAGYAHVAIMVPRADDKKKLMWHGWALREAFVTGAEWQEARGADGKERRMR